MTDPRPELLKAEYFQLVEIVTDFDKRLLTVKGWGVTLSLAAIAWAFQDGHYGLFLVAAISGLAFWVLEAVFKQHQMRYYLRMREIEVINYDQLRFPLSDGVEVSTPMMDWSWTHAPRYFSGKTRGAPAAPTRYGKFEAYRYGWLFPHVSMPHAITVVVGLVLFALGATGMLGMPL